MDTKWKRGQTFFGVPKSVDEGIAIAGGLLLGVLLNSVKRLRRKQAARFFRK